MPYKPDPIVKKKRAQSLERAELVTESRRHRRTRREMGRVATLVGVAVALWLAAVMLPEVAAVRILVGKGMGDAWTTNVNYTVWAQGWHFYNGDWLCILSLSLVFRSVTQI